MKKQVIKFTLFFVTLLFIGNIYSQGVSFEATIENQTVVGTDFYFDIYLTRTGTNDLYLGDAQFILTFNNLAFTDPDLFLDPDDDTFINLTNSNSTFCGNWYYPNFAYSLSGNQIQISINLVIFNTQTQFNARIAKIGNQPSTHRIGRWKISGITNSSANMNLQWVSSPSINPHSRVFSLANTTPWNSTEAAGTWTNPTSEPLPVELSSFTGKVVDGKKVDLNWITKTEVNNYGFNIERRIKDGEWNNIGFVEGQGNSNSPKTYKFIDNSLFSGGSNFQYRLKQVDNDGQFKYSDVVEVEIVPAKFELLQNYPNPFNPSTTIRFSLPVATQLKINIYNMLGQLVQTLAEGKYEAGYHKVTFDASGLPSGAYVYRIESSEYTQVMKMVLMK